MTEGEKTVILVRAQALSNALNSLVGLGDWYGFFWTPFAEEAHWQAQRLRSSCERALGTRER